MVTLDETLNLARNYLPSYNSDMVGRFNPLTPEFITSLMEDQTISGYSGQPILNVNDAVQHAINLASQWAEQDKALEELNVLIATAPEPVKEEIVVTPQKDIETAQAKQTWRSAVAQRNKVVAEWDNYVTQCREYYHQLRDTNK